MAWQYQIVKKSIMDRWIGKTAVVTGASAGIGADIALTLADAGMVVVAAARSFDKLQQLATQVTGTGKILPFQCDMAKESSIIELFQFTKTNAIGVDVLVNNAAVLPPGTITDCGEKATYVDSSNIELCINTNILGVITATRCAVEDMKSRNCKGYIIVMNSIAGHKMPSPGIFPQVSVYASTKYALTHLTETLRMELAFTNAQIRITSLSPGAVDTAMITLIPGLGDAGIPMLRCSDISDTVVYLLSTPDHINISELTIQTTGECM